MSDQDTDSPARRRLRGFGLHIIGYFLVMAAVVVVNLAATPETVWFVWPGVGWGGVLAIHAAFAMGLFGDAGD
ncbi:MAG: 2TM domain-containing protein [Alphaproteobacteria bacterium]